MVSPAGFEPATPGLEGPHFGVSGVFPMRYTPYISTDPGFRSIYAVAPKTPIPWLRGDGCHASLTRPNNIPRSWATIPHAFSAVSSGWPRLRYLRSYRETGGPVPEITRVTGDESSPEHHQSRVPHAKGPPFGSRYTAFRVEHTSRAVTIPP